MEYVTYIFTLFFLCNQTVFNFLLKNGISEESNAGELLCLELNKELKKNMFIFKNIRVGARTYATVKAENFVFIGKYANLLPVITYQI